MRPMFAHFCVCVQLYTVQETEGEDRNCWNHVQTCFFGQNNHLQVQDPDCSVAYDTHRFFTEHDKRTMQSPVSNYRRIRFKTIHAESERISPNLKISALHSEVN